MINSNKIYPIIQEYWIEKKKPCFYSFKNHLYQRKMIPIKRVLIISIFHVQSQIIHTHFSLENS